MSAGVLALAFEGVVRNCGQGRRLQSRKAINRKKEPVVLRVERHLKPHPAFRINLLEFEGGQ